MGNEQNRKPQSQAEVHVTGFPLGSESRLEAGLSPGGSDPSARQGALCRASRQGGGGGGGHLALQEGLPPLPLPPACQLRPQPLSQGAVLPAPPVQTRLEPAELPGQGKAAQRFTSSSDTLMRGEGSQCAATGF